MEIDSCGLGLSGKPVNSSNCIAEESSKSQVHSFNLCTHYCWVKQCCRNWILLYSTICCIQSSNVIPCEFTESKSVGCIIDANRTTNRSWNFLVRKFLSRIVEVGDEIVCCLREEHLRMSNNQKLEVIKPLRMTYSR
jgi:hypothetical protein